MRFFTHDSIINWYPQLKQHLIKLLLEYKLLKNQFSCRVLMFVNFIMWHVMIVSHDESVNFSLNYFLKIIKWSKILKN